MCGNFPRPRGALPRHDLFGRMGAGSFRRGKTSLARFRGASSMQDNDILILTGNEIRKLLTGRELEVISTVQSAYETHAKGDSSLPHSSFLRFLANEKNRI